VIRPKDLPELDRLRQQLLHYEMVHGELPGLLDASYRESLLEQIIESERRKTYLAYVRGADVELVSADALSPFFDPLRAAVHHHRRGDLGEAFWMLFLFAHFGRHRTSRWFYAQQVYAGGGSPWTWLRVVDDITGFRDWLEANQQVIRQHSGSRGFGNHRKFESLSGWSPVGTGAVVASYLNWVGDAGTHLTIVPNAGIGLSQPTFDDLYQSMATVHRFGRLARFDYLTTAARIGLITVDATKLYLAGSTGPLAGAKLLFDRPDLSTDQLDELAAAFGAHLAIESDTLEDALCNWQKSPDVFRSFRG